MSSPLKNKSLVTLAAAHFLTDVNLGSLPAVLPFLVSVYGFDYRAVAGLVFASSCLSTFVQPLFGWLADKGSKQWFLGLGILLSGIPFGLSGLTNEYWLIFGLILLSGIGSAIFHPEAAKLVNAVSEGKKGTGISIFSVGGNAGFGAGPLLAVFLITSFGMKGLSVYALLSLLMGGALLVFGRNLGEVKKKDPVKTAVPVSEEISNDWHGFGRLTVFILLRSTAWVGISSFLPLFCIQALGTSNAVGSGTLTVLCFAGVFCTLLGGPLGDRYGYVRMIQAGSLLLIPAFALCVLPHSLFWVYAMLIPISIAFNVTYSPFIVLGQSYLARSVGFASGITMGISFSAGGIVAPFLGWFGDLYGITSVMVLLIVIAAADALIAKFLPQPAGLKKKTI